MDSAHIYHLIKRYATLNNIVLVVAGFVVVASIYNTMATLQKNFVLQQKVNMLEQEIQLTQLEVDTLKLQQQYLASAEYQELTARAKLGKVSPGESVINLPPAPKTENQTTQPSRTTDTRTNFEKWMQFFFGR